MPQKLRFEGHADEDLESCKDEGTLEIRVGEQRIICTYSFSAPPDSEPREGEPTEGAVYSYENGVLRRHAFRGRKLDSPAYGHPNKYEDLPEGGFAAICEVFRSYAEHFEVPVTEA